MANIRPLPRVATAAVHLLGIVLVLGGGAAVVGSPIAAILLGKMDMAEMALGVVGGALAIGVGLMLWVRRKVLFDRSEQRVFAWWDCMGVALKRQQFHFSDFEALTIVPVDRNRIVDLWPKRQIAFAVTLEGGWIHLRIRTYRSDGPARKLATQISQYIKIDFLDYVFS